MTTMNADSTRFRILMMVLLTTIVACGGPEADSPDGLQAQPPEKANDLQNVVDNDNATEEMHSEATYSRLAYNGVCGPGYQVINSHSLTGSTVYLTYNSSTGKNCVVTVRSTSGSRLSMCAKVSRAYAPWISDCGSYTTYAGPVYVDARNACIDWGGSIGNSPYYQYNAHCG
jgi:hypothetical protein